MFSNKTTLKDITNYEGKLDPPNDLLNVKKDILLRYISYLITESSAKDAEIDRLSVTSSAKDTVIEKLTSTFETTINNIMEKKLNHAVAVNTTQPEQHSHQTTEVKPVQTEIDPYSSYSENFLETELYQEVLDLLPELQYKAVKDQREVCYFGEFRYKYNGGCHEPAVLPEPLKKVVNYVKKTYSENKNIVSVLITKYLDGQKWCPAHSDDELTIDPSSDIYTISFGAKRPMEFTKIHSTGSVQSLALSDNSILIFSRLSQSYWRHGIPKCDDETGPRYSITIRVNEPYHLNSTVVIGDSNTKGINFGDGPNCLGKWVPGTRIHASKIEDIPTPDKIGPYRNVIVHTGINNISRGNCKPAAELINDLKRKCSDIHITYPTAKIFISPVLPTKNYNLNVKVCMYNELLYDMCKNHHNLFIMNNAIFLDWHTYLMKDEYHNKKAGDILHLGKLGLKRFAMSFKAYVLGRSPHIVQSMNYKQAFNSLS